jgi:hypothetical protein
MDSMREWTQYELTTTAGAVEQPTWKLVVLDGSATFPAWGLPPLGG